MARTLETLLQMQSLKRLRTDYLKLRPQLATLSTSIPEGTDWIHEQKFDGYRFLCIIHKKQCAIISRNGKRWEQREALTELVKSLRELPEKDLVLDGELVAAARRGKGKADRGFALLQETINTAGSSRLIFYCFDILALRGFDLRPLPLGERKLILQSLLQPATQYNLKLVPFFIGGGASQFNKARRNHWEGIVSKHIFGIYQSRRTPDWLKIKCAKRDDFLILGFTLLRKHEKAVGALLLGAYNAAKGQITYCGKVGTGFSDLERRSFYKLLKRDELRTPAIAKRLRVGSKIIWIRPRKVVEVSYTEWTTEGRLRHPTFVSLRSDKPVAEVIIQRTE